MLGFVEETLSHHIINWLTNEVAHSLAISLYSFIGQSNCCDIAERFKVKVTACGSVRCDQ